MIEDTETDPKVSLEPVPFRGSNEFSLEGCGRDRITEAVLNNLQELLDSNEDDDDITGTITLANTESQPAPRAARSRRHKKKSNGMPKRPLSAYNLYFRSERAKLVSIARKGGAAKVVFEELGKIIGRKWKEIDDLERNIFGSLAEKESIRYHEEMEVYKKRKRNKDIEFEEQMSRSTSTNVSSCSVASDLDHKQVEEEAQQGQDLQEPLPDLPVEIGQSHPIPSQSDHHQRHQFQPDGNLVTYPEFRVEGVIPAHYQGSQRIIITPEVGAPHQHSAPNAQAGSPLSLPPPTPPTSGSFSIPPGMEIYLNSRKYFVQYSWHYMPRNEARKMVDSFTGLANSNTGRPPW